MAENIALTLKGAKQGDIKGGNTVKGREGTIDVIAYEYSLLSPTDAQSGLPTGRRQHKPIKIVKYVDKSSPLLFHSIVMNEDLTATFKWWRPDPKGQGGSVQFYTTEFTGGRIVNIRTFLPNTQHPDTLKFHPMEEVEFTFHKYTTTIVDGGISAEDSWDSHNT